MLECVILWLGNLIMVVMVIDCQGSKFISGCTISRKLTYHLKVVDFDQRGLLHRSSSESVGNEA